MTEQIEVLEDSYIVRNLLDDDIASVIYENLDSSVHWQEMMHKGGAVPRLVAIESTKSIDGMGNIDGPIYRHPVDEEPATRDFNCYTSLIAMKIQEIVKHPLNHSLIQKYRHGHDYISEHADKTLDISMNTFICNFTAGAARTMVFKSKCKYDRDGNEDINGVRKIHRVQLTHNSLFLLGWRTNQMYTHSVQQDKRMDSLKSAEELAFGGQRISLTYRSIGTFARHLKVPVTIIFPDMSTRTVDEILYGQGALLATAEEATAFVAMCEAKSWNSHNPMLERWMDEHTQTMQLLAAFTQENRSVQCWEDLYGRHGGFTIRRIAQI